MHFVKAGRFAKSKDELQLLLQHMENAVPTPILDSLNVLNGINFAQFLEAVMRIAYARHLENNAGIAKNLQFALQDATLEIRNRRRDDELYSSLFGHKFTKIFKVSRLLSLRKSTTSWPGYLSNKRLSRATQTTFSTQLSTSRSSKM